MLKNKTFWAAFFAGIAAPAGLYAAPTPYMSYVRRHSLPEIFGVVGRRMTEAAGRTVDVKVPSETTEPQLAE